MTPAEVTTILRQFNGWRRDFDDKFEQPDSREISEAIDAAVEMIDRLEAAESEAIEEARLNGMGSEREAALMAKLEAAEKSDAESIAMYRKARDERDALRAKIEAMEKQEPVATVIKEGDSRYWMSERLWTFPDGKYPLYALPGAQTQGEGK